MTMRDGRQPRCGLSSARARHSSSHIPLPEPSHRLLPRLLLGLLRVLWDLVRLPIFAALILIEPVVSTALLACALIGVLVALLLRFATTLPHVPFWGMLGV